MCWVPSMLHAEPIGWQVSIVSRVNGAFTGEFAVRERRLSAAVSYLTNLFNYVFFCNATTEKFSDLQRILVKNSVRLVIWYKLSILKQNVHKCKFRFCWLAYIVTSTILATFTKKTLLCVCLKVSKFWTTVSMLWIKSLKGKQSVCGCVALPGLARHGHDNKTHPACNRVRRLHTAPSTCRQSIWLQKLYWLELLKPASAGCWIKVLAIVSSCINFSLLPQGVVNELLV